MSVRASRVFFAMSVALFFVGAIGFGAHGARVQPTGRGVYAILLVVPLMLLGLPRFAPKRANGDIDVPATGAVGFLVALLGAPLFVFSAVVFANAWLDASPRSPAELRIVERTLSSDADGDWAYHAELADPATPGETLALHVDRPPLPDASKGSLRVAVCPGALGIRWFCAMPSR